MFKTTQKLKQWMKIKGWTQRRLAKEMGYHETDLSVVLNGHKPPSWAMLKKLCLLTGLDVGDIITYQRK